METLKAVFQVKSSDIAYLRGTVESYDGMAVVRTIDPNAALIELQISPGCEDLVLEILDHLAKYENLHLAPITASANQFQEGGAPQVTLKSEGPRRRHR